MLMMVVAASRWGWPAGARWLCYHLKFRATFWTVGPDLIRGKTWREMVALNSVHV